MSSMLNHLPKIARTRTYKLVFALGTALLVTLGAGGVQQVRAQVSTTFSTTTAVQPGATLTETVNTPGFTITGTTPAGGCAVTGIGSSVVTYTCTQAGTGIAVGTPITQTFAGPNSGPVSETITYNANGPVSANPGATTPTAVAGNCTAPAVSPGTATCAVQATVVTVPGGTFAIAVNGVGAQTVQIVQAPPTLGGCPTSTLIPTAISGAGGSATVTYTCTTGQIPIGTTAQLTVNTTAGAGTAPAIAASQNGNAPIAGTPAIPAPTTQTVSAGSGPSASIVSINPSSGPAGTVVTLAGSNLTGATGVSFGATAATVFNCNAAGNSCTATAPALAAGTSVNVTVSTPSGTSNPLSFSFTSSTPQPPQGFLVTYSPGWNIVAGPAGTVITGTNGPLYTYQSGNTAYQTIPAGSQLRTGWGYWAYFNSTTTVGITLSSPQTISMQLPPSQWVMVGNPGNTSATVSGADVVYTFDPGINNYTAQTTIAPGQGAWAISLNGGTITITNASR